LPLFSPSSAVCRISLLVLILIMAGAPDGTAQNAESVSSPRFLTRLTATGAANSSDPQGYKAYSSIHLEIGVRRPITSTLAMELDLAHESREVDWMGPEKEESLGSIELLPVHLLLQYRPLMHKWHPYIGAGVNYTLFWEKSGELNSKKLSPSAGPVLQLGVDRPLSSHIVLNLDIKFIRMKTDFEGWQKEQIELSIHPTAMGIGLGFKL
ncbi:OmpW family protein, partial [bacterium]|nr:OmpW family protein [bacterium]